MSDEPDKHVFKVNGADVLMTSSSEASLSSGSSSSAASSAQFPIDNRPATLSDLHTTTLVTVLSGSWVAYNQNGTTFYSSGSSVVSGAINLGYSASLDIKSGAVVSGIRGGGSYQYPSVTIESGGTLEHSNIENGYLTISSGGVAYRNLYDSVVTSVCSGGTSINDTVFTSAGYNYDPMTVYAGGTAEHTIVSSGGTLIISSGGSGLNVSGDTSAYISAASSSYISGYHLKNGSEIYGYGTIQGAGSNTPDIGAGTTGRTVLTGDWSAVEIGGTGSSHSGGTTVYVSGGATVTGNVTLGNAWLYVQSGATASHVNVASGYIDDIMVSSGGTLENSTFPNGYIWIYSGGVTKNNNFNSDPAYYSSGATSINDTFYDSGYPAGDVTWVYSGATMENPYISSGGIVSSYYGGKISNPTQNGGTLFDSTSTIETTLTGVWSAVNSNGTTVYQSGGTVVSGDITLGSLSTLDVMSGADADNVQSISGSEVSIIVSSGGTLSDSYVNDGTVWISSGGTASHNLYNSVPVHISSGAVDSAGTYFNSSYSDNNGGTVYSGGTAINDVESGAGGFLTVNSGGLQSGGSVMSGAVLTIHSTGTSIGGTLISGGTENVAGSADNIVVSSGGILNFTGQSYNSATVAKRAPLGLPSSSFSLNEGAWQAIASNGVVYYESAYSSGQNTHYVSSGGSLVNAGRATSAGTTILSGNMQVDDAVSVEITSGAVVSGLTTDSGGIGTVIIDSGGTLESSYMQNGYVTIKSGGTGLGNVYNSTPVYVQSGGVDSDGTQYAGSGYDAIGGGTVYGGGTLVRPYISAGGSVIQSAGGTVIDPVIVSGGAFEGVTGGLALPSSASTLHGSWKAVQSNGTILYESSYSSGQHNVQILRNKTLISGATAQSTGTTILSGAVTLASGATIEVTSGANVSGLDTTSGGIATVTVDNGGTLTSSYIENGYTYINSGGTGIGNVYNSTPVYVSSGGVDSKGSYYNYVYAAGEGATVYSNGTLLDPLVSNGGSITISSGGTVNNPVAVGGGHIYIAGGGVNTCFLEGTLIKTADGLKPVESLRPGDFVMTIINGEEIAEEICWVGEGNASFTHQGGASPANIEDYPIRVKKDSFAENMPFKDLLLTPEHCLYFDGHFVPVRMLVNGRSIFYDTCFENYSYYHFETQKHAIIWADGVLSESYLDTGHRAENFDKAQFCLAGYEDFIVQRGALSWEEDSAVPLNVTRDFVEPLYRIFEARARDLSLEKIRYPWQLEEEQENTPSEVCIMAGKREIYPLRKSENYVLYKVPRNVKEVSLRAPIARPADVIGPFIDDRRYLGCLVGEVKLITAEKEISLTDHLEDENLPGWSVLEKGPCRWTAGNAVIPFKNKLNAHRENIVGEEETVMLAVQLIEKCVA